MATKDKLVTLEDLKIVNDDLQGKVENFNSDINDIKNTIIPQTINTALTDIREYEDKSAELVSGYYIPTAAMGNTIDLTDIRSGSGATRRQAYALFDLNAGDKVVLTGQSLVGGAYRALSLVDSSGTVLETVPSEGAYKTWEKTASVNCKCLINVVVWNSASGDFNNTIIIIKDDNFDILRTDADRALELTAPLSTSDGWFTLPAENFARNDWTNWAGGTTSRTNRVRYDKVLSFPRRVFILAAPGFYINGYYSDGVFSAMKCIELPANKQVRIYVRRISEVSETADIAEFASAMLISSALAGMEKYEHMFTDITMFPRVGLVGDSYTSGGGIISGVTELTWGKNLERESGVAVDIYARSGESIVGWVTNTTTGLPALLAGEECGLYWFAHGINGTSTDEQLGTPEDMQAEPKPATFYGQYVYAIQTIKRKFPKAKIVIATIVGTGYDLYETVYTKVNVAIRNIAEYCGVPLIDLPNDDFYKSPWYNHNHLSNHPTAMLNAGIAHANRRLLAKCIIENAEYFRNYGNKSTFAVSILPSEGGTVDASPNTSASGYTITLSNSAQSGYHFVRYDTTDVTISDGSFTMPNRKVTIQGVFESN